MGENELQVPIFEFQVSATVQGSRAKVQGFLFLTFDF